MGSADGRALPGVLGGDDVAYEVTKQIKGRPYRYRVDSERDPVTGRTRARWQYLGRLDGEGVIAPGRPRLRRVTRDDVIATTARLLETRDASRVTVAVIAHDAGISPGTFYRHFPDRQSALQAALASLCVAALRSLPSLAGPIGTVSEERARLAAWFEAFGRAALGSRALRWLLAAPARGERIPSDCATLGKSTRRMLGEYLRRLDGQGRAQINDPDALAAALLRLHLSIVRETALTDAADDASRWAAVFPVVERAVFPHGAAA
jgi:AcrR family transcriptional regulator